MSQEGSTEFELMLLIKTSGLRKDILCNDTHHSTTLLLELGKKPKENVQSVTADG